MEGRREGGEGRPDMKSGQVRRAAAAPWARDGAPPDPPRPPSAASAAAQHGNEAGINASSLRLYYGQQGRAALTQCIQLASLGNSLPVPPHAEGQGGAAGGSGE